MKSQPTGKARSPKKVRKGALLQSLEGYLGFIGLALRLFFDGRVPTKPKWIMVGAFVYLISPLDAFIPVIDDAIITVFCSQEFIRRCPAELVKEHMEKMDWGKTKG